MKDIVVVTAYWRPQYVAKCLQALRDCDGIADKEVWVFQDDRDSLTSLYRPGHAETTDTIKSVPDLYARFVQRPPHDFDTTGQTANHPTSYNTFNGLKEAYESGAKHVYLVADDILVTPDFFRWSEAVHNDGDHFSTVAERVYQDTLPEPKPFNLSAYYQAPTSLMDAGMCWRREKLKLLLGDGQVRDHRFPLPLTEQEYRPMIPFVHRAYHVGKVSTAVYEDKINYRGDCDEIPEVMPHYEWDKVYRLE